MNIASYRIHSIIAALVIGALVLWSFTPPFFVRHADAASLTSYSDTLSDSDYGVASDHTIRFTTLNGVSAGESFTITFNSFTVPGGDETASMGSSSISFYDDSGLKAIKNGAASAALWGISTTSDSMTFTAGTDEIASSTSVTIYIGTLATTSGSAGTSQLTNPNPGTPTSYVITTALPVDSADARVALVGDVTVTATVDSSLTFTVSAVLAGQTINNAAATTTANDSTATTLPFGTLIVDEERLMAQTLSVETNASNGFTVTVYQDNDLTSESNATIDTFANGGASSSPVAWVAPAAYLDVDNTYGHMGLTTEDSSLSDNDSFLDDLWVGNFDGPTSPREVFYHDGPSDGTTANIGQTRVGYQIEISSLQEAGALYTNTLTYIATPVF